MTPEAQIIAIAETYGWLRLPPDPSEPFLKPERWVSNKKTAYHWTQLPNYLGDRNAMHEVLESLTMEEFLTYRINLLRTADERTYYTIDRDMLIPSLKRMAQAYLKTKGIWTS